MKATTLASKTFHKILKYYGKKLTPANMEQPHRTVLLVYHTQGLIGNGGFHRLFEGNYKGDPEFLLTRQAFKTINAKGASAAFDKAFSVFPNSTPPDDIESRLETWESHYPTPASVMNDDESADVTYFKAMDETWELLAAYIRNNKDAFASLKTESP